jgi:hypothetical protein
MNKVLTVLISLCILFLLVVPAQAFTAKSLTITLAPNGDAEMNMQYELSFRAGSRILPDRESLPGTQESV